MIPASTSQVRRPPTSGRPYLREWLAQSVQVGRWHEHVVWNVVRGDEESRRFCDHAVDRERLFTGEVRGNCLTPVLFTLLFHRKASPIRSVVRGQLEGQTVPRHDEVEDVPVAEFVREDADGP